MNDSDTRPSSNQSLVAKLLIVGDSRVGKSCLLTRFTEAMYTPNSTMTVGIDCKSKKIQVDDSIMKLQIWDTAGQEKYRSITQNFYKNALGVIIVFDLTDRTSFENVKKWIVQIKNNSDLDICMMLAANKCDDELNRVVSKEEIGQFVQEREISWYETSAKEDINVQEIFLSIAREIKLRFFAPNESIKGSFRDPSLRRTLTSASLVQKQKPENDSKCCL